MPKSPRLATWIALFRGINVGGRNLLPMKEIVRDLESLGLEQVRTYIQSGNAVFRSAGESAAALGARIAARVEASRGFRPQVLVLSAGELEAAAGANPFPEADGEPRSVHLFFLASPPAAPDAASLEAARSSSERFHLSDRVFYLNAPDGIGRSKLAASVERLLGVAVTARNWRTVGKLREMAGALE